MSTKTLRKRIALVAVAALAVTGLSTVSANAAAITAWTKYEGNVTSISLSRATATPVAGSAVYVNVGAKTTAVGTVAGATTTGAITQLRGALVSYPAGGFVQVTSSTNVAGASAGTPTVPTGADVVITNTNNTGATGANSIFIRDTDDAAGLAVYDVTTSATTGLASMTFTPTVAGTYELRVWNDGPAQGATTIGNNAIDSNEAVQSISIVVAAASGYSAALSTAFMVEDLTDGDNSAQPTATTDASAKPLAIRTIGQKAATIVVTTRDTDNAVYTGQTITATMSGSGFVSAGSAAGGASATDTQIDTADGSATTTRTASVASAANTTGVVAIGVWGDGTAGTGTVTISVTDKVSGATTTLATKTVTWYSGTAATLEATVLQSIATPGAANGCSNATTCTQATLALTPAVVVVAKDSGGRVIPGLTIVGTPADTAIIASTTVTAVTGGNDKNGRGYYNVSVTGGSSANVGKKAKVTFSTTLADGVTVIKAADVEFSLAGTPASVTMSVDKASYTPGAPVKITVTAKDAAGNLAADGTYANLFAGASTLGGSFTGSTPAASVEIKNGVATYDAFAPGTSGTYSISNKLGTSLPAAVQGATVTTSVAVGSSAEIASVDAKIAALVAAIAKLQAAINKINKRLKR
jgi:trimeric autotransporter adhesin